MEKENKSNLNRQDCSYITFSTVDWVDIFIRPSYKQIIADTLNHLIQHKKFTVYAWCLMSNHLHLVARAHDGSGLAAIEKEFKKQTTNAMLGIIDSEPDLRKNWMLQRFEQSSQNLKRLERFQLWQSCSNPTHIDFNHVFKLQERILFVHENPVRDKIVASPSEYLYSSAGDYAGKKGLVNVTVINFEQLRLSILKNGSS
jgi:putative transposase